jgi:hypothetical protein
VFDISMYNTNIRKKSDWKAVYEIKEESNGPSTHLITPPAMSIGFNTHP